MLPQSVCILPTESLWYFHVMLGPRRKQGDGISLFKIEKLNIMLKKYESGKNNSMKLVGGI